MINQIVKQVKLFNQVTQNFSGFHKKPVRVAITGGAGQIAYSLIFRVASGDMLGKDQPVIIQLLDLPPFQNKLKGVQMEINDCSFPLVQDVIITDNQSVAFKDTDYALLVGAKPRTKGMERGDLLKDNGKIFIETGKAISDNSSRNIKCLVVGNPANTNCLILSHYAKGIPKENFTAMTRLDHNRALFQLAQQTKSHMYDVSHLCVWGNHSPTMYPDLTHATVKGKSALSLVDQKWVDTYFNPTVQQRGAEIIKAREASSAASAGNAALEHIRDWVLGSRGWTSMGISSNGNTYGVPEGLIFSFPVHCGNGKYEVVNGLKINEYSRAKIEVTTKELLEERKAVEHLLN